MNKPIVKMLVLNLVIIGTINLITLGQTKSNHKVLTNDDLNTKKPNVAIVEYEYYKRSYRTITTVGVLDINPTSFIKLRRSRGKYYFVFVDKNQLGQIILSNEQLKEFSQGLTLNRVSYYTDGNSILKADPTNKEILVLEISTGIQSSSFKLSSETQHKFLQLLTTELNKL